MKDSSIASAFVALALLASPAGAQPSPTTGAQTPPHAVRDQSLSASDYAQLGVPAVDHAWTMADYQTAATALATLPTTQLPHYASAASGSTFNRLIDSSVLDHCRDRSVPIQTRATPCVSLTRSVTPIVDGYIAAFRSDPNGRAEDFMRVSAFILRTESVMSGVADEFREALDPNAPDYATRLHGIDQMHAGMATTLGAAAQMMSVPRQFSEAARLELARALASDGQVLIAALDESARAPVLASLRLIAQSDPSPAVRDALALYR